MGSKTKIFSYTIIQGLTNIDGAKTHPSRLNFEVSNDGAWPAGTWLIKTSTLQADVVNM